MKAVVCLKYSVGFLGKGIGRALVTGLMLLAGSGTYAGGLQTLTAEQMGAVQGQAMLTVPLVEESADGEALSLEVLDFVARSLMPVMAVLTSDSQVQGVHFPQDAAIRVREDGALQLPMPSRIERITLNRIRVAESSNSLGNVTLHNIRFHPDSRLVIRTH